MQASCEGRGTKKGNQVLPSGIQPDRVAAASRGKMCRLCDLEIGHGRGARPESPRVNFLILCLLTLPPREAWWGGSLRPRKRGERGGGSRNQSDQVFLIANDSLLTTATPTPPAFAPLRPAFLDPGLPRFARAPG